MSAPDRRMDPEIEADCFDQHRGEYVVFWDKHVNLMRQRDELVEALRRMVDMVPFGEEPAFATTLLAKLQETGNE